MATFNKKELDDLRTFAMSSKEIIQLIEEKKETLDKLNNNKSSDFQTPTPAPKPEGDIRLTSEKGIDRGLKDAQSKIIEGTRNSYDDKIDKVARENINNFGYDHHKEKMDMLSKDDVVLLVEKDSDTVLDKYKQQELEKINSDKEPIQDVDVEKSMKLSSAQRDEIMERGSLIDLDDSSKDMDVGKGDLEREASDFQKNSKDITSDDFE